jgi:hypothetical protein
MMIFAENRIRKVMNHHEWYISIKPSFSSTLYRVGAIDSPKSLASILIFLAGSARCSSIVPMIEVRDISEKITIANFIEEKRPQILSITVFRSSDN